jgi:hypothetical protein
MRTVFQGSGTPHSRPWNQSHLRDGGGDCEGGGGGAVGAKKMPAHGAVGGFAGTVAGRGGNFGDGFGGDSGDHRLQQAAKSLSVSGSTANVSKWEPATPCQWPDSGPGASKWNQAAVRSGSGGFSFSWTNGGGVHQPQVQPAAVNGPSATIDAREPPVTPSLALPMKPWTSVAGGGTWRGGDADAGSGAPSESAPCRAFDRRSGNEQQQLQPPALLQPAVPVVPAAGSAAMRTVSPRPASAEGWRMLI